MSQNKETVKKYMHAFGRSNHEEVLACLTDNVEWIIPGAIRWVIGYEQLPWDEVTTDT